MTYFSVRVHKKTAQTACYLSYLFRRSFYKIDNVECLLHVLLNCLVFQIIFSKIRFSKTSFIFSPVFNRFHRNFTGRTYDSNRPVYGRTGPVKDFLTGSSSGLKCGSWFARLTPTPSPSLCPQMFEHFFEFNVILNFSSKLIYSKEENFENVLSLMITPPLE